MRVVKAAELGLCFGVKDALQIAFEQRDPQQVTIHGELVHNETVLDGLRHAGFAMTPESRRVRLPGTAKVLVTAHGISDRERSRLVRAGKELIDTTCPLVRKAHDAAMRLHEAGYHVIVIGKPGHVEVRGLVGDLRSYDVVPSAEMVGRYPYPRLGVVCQTTCTEGVAREVIDAIRACNPDAEVHFVDTICEPTRQRIRAVEALALSADAVVVVGGRGSNNTRQLVLLCEESGCPAYHVQGASDLDPSWFEGCGTVGLTAGTSTPDSTIEEVFAALCKLARTAVVPAGRGSKAM